MLNLSKHFIVMLMSNTLTLSVLYLNLSSLVRKQLHDSLVPIPYYVFQVLVFRYSI